MQNNDILRHNDVAEKGWTQPAIEDVIALYKVVKQLDDGVLNLAKNLKTSIGGINVGSVDGINKLTQATRLSNEVMTAREKTIKDVKKAEELLTESVSLESQELARLRLEIQRVNKENKDQAKQQSITTSEFDKASMKLVQLKNAWKSLAIVNKENTIEAKALKKEIDSLDATLKKISFSVGDYGRNVGNYASGTQQLRHAFNQLTREAPAFGNSLQTGFMALSNNIPMFVDQINSLRESNKRLNEEGVKTEPIYKTLGKTIFSFQTFLSAGVTLLTLFGAKLFEAAGGMLGYEDATKAAEKAQKKFNQTIRDGIENVDAGLQTNLETIELNREAEIRLAKERGATAKEIYEIEKKYNDQSISELYKYITSKETLQQEASRRQDKINKMEDGEAKDKAQEAFDADQKMLSDNISEMYAMEQKFIAQNRAANIAMRAEELAEKKKAKEDAEKLLIEALELQHKINVLEIESIKDANERKKLLMEEEAMFEMQMNEFRIKNAQKREEVNLGIAKKFEREMKEILDAEDKAFKDSLDKQFDDFTKQQNAIAEGLADNDALSAKQAKEKTKADEKARKEALKAQQKFFKDSISLVEQNEKQENQIQLNKTETEINNSKRRSDMLKELAIKGSKDAADSIALEERRQAELEAKKFKQQKAQKQSELFFTAYKAYAANLESNPKIAVEKTLKDLIKLNAGIKALPSFEEGTEDTGENGPGIDGKGGKLSILHPKEKVFNRKDSQKIGYDISNEQVANIVQMWKMGAMPEIIMSNHVDDRLLGETKVMSDKIETLTKVIENKPVSNLRFDELNKAFVEVLENKNNRKINRSTR